MLAVLSRQVIERYGIVMNFTSSLFIFYFLPVVLLGLLLLKVLKAKDTVISCFILAASLVFYAWDGIINLGIILLISILNYLAARLIERSSHAKGVFVTSIIVNVGILAGYKYTSFFINGIIGRLLPIGEVTLSLPKIPLGLSFFTFLSIAYLTDVYKKKIAAEHNILKYLEYIFLFPKATMGPITRYGSMKADLYSHNTNSDNAYQGILRFCIGFAKKVLLADQMALMADTIFAATGTLHPLYSWVGILSYTLQIYLDFSAYSDMAIGIGQVFGLTILENFNYPYISKSIKEFWRRWHISLSSWFRDYIYIPLGGNRKGQLITYRNQLIVFFLTGLWHGASFNFIVWGLYYGVFLLLEKTRPGALLEKLPKAVQHIYALLVVMIGWVFFRSDNLTNSLIYIGSMFGITDGTLNNLDIAKSFTPHYFFLLGCSILACTPIAKVAGSKLKCGILKDIAVLVLFFIALCYMVSSSYSPFIYARF